MKASYIILLVILFLFSSCALTNAGGSIKVDDLTGRPYYEQESINGQIYFYGDYWFHPIKDFINPFTTKKYIKYLKSSVANHKPQIMYSAHTIVSPYYSTIAFYYKNATADASLIRQVNKHLLKDLKSSFKDVQEINTNIGKATRVDYDIFNPYTKIKLCFTEFFMNIQNNMLRFCFWTQDCNDPIIKREIQGLIKEIKPTN